MLAQALPLAVKDGADLDARGGLLYGAYLAGTGVRARPAPGCTTRSATCWAAGTACRTRRRTPSCCPT